MRQPGRRFWRAVVSTDAIDRLRPEPGPLVTVRYQGVVDDATFERHLDDLRARLKGGSSYIVMFDARHAGAAPASRRRCQADFIRDHQEILAKLCLGNAFVISNPIVRGILTAILWVQPLPYPHVVVSTIDEAEVWCTRKLSEAGLAEANALAAA